MSFIRDLGVIETVVEVRIVLVSLFGLGFMRFRHGKCTACTIKIGTIFG